MGQHVKSSPLYADLEITIEGHHNDALPVTSSVLQFRSVN